MSENKMPSPEGWPDILAVGSTTTNDLKVLGILMDSVDEVKNVKVTYKLNEKDPETVDFFLNEKYLESCPSSHPKILLDFRATKIEHGYALGAAFVLNKILEGIQKTDK